MERVIYHKTAAIEDIHWWFIGRRFITEQIIQGLSLQNNAEILEVGCGTGGNLGLLAKYGQVYGVELDEQALEYSRKRKIGTILQGSLPDEIPFADRLFDLIVMTDVLEHVEADQLSLERLYARLKSGGHLLVTVPAFPALWSRHDESHHHKRRYTRGELRTKFIKAQYCIVKANYFNFFLFPVIVTRRLMQRFFRKTNTDDLVLPSPLINELLAKLFASEGYLLKVVSLPFGLSLLFVGHKV
jgi:SAM-dependent methyltransferase